jgi:hypothetical protein|nr:DUF6625 family protein [uncultured Acetatifactor sp.]
MQSVAFVVPWEGKLPEYFALWLMTCGNNPSIDFLVFTDDTTEYQYPTNVKPVYFPKGGVGELIQKNFNFEINVERPYKFCDYRPAFGEIFRDYLRGYDFWGHCDIDLFWGNIRTFVTDDVLNKYNRIYTRGHCCLYRNIAEVNAWYRKLPRCGCQDWKEVYRVPETRCFDEWAGHCGGGVSAIIKANGIEVYDAVDMADLNRKRGHFMIGRRKDLWHKNLCFKYSNGKIVAFDGERELAEFLYVHFQKRKLVIKENISSEFYFIAPNMVEKQFVETHFWRCIVYTCLMFFNRVKRKCLTFLKEER